MSVHYQPKANTLNQSNAVRITIDGFDVLIAKHTTGYKATFMNGHNYTNHYNEEFLHDTIFASFEESKVQCEKYTAEICESAYESTYDL